MFRRKKSLAFTAIKSENLRRFKAFRTDTPRKEPLGAPKLRCIIRLLHQFPAVPIPPPGPTPANAPRRGQTGCSNAPRYR